MIKNKQKDIEQINKTMCEQNGNIKRETENLKGN